MGSILVFILGAALLIFSAEKLIGYLVGVASGLRVSLFLLAIVFTGIEFDDIFLGLALNLEDLDGVALGIVFGTALSLPGLVLALAAILTPTQVSIPRDYLALFAGAPLVMIVFTMLAPLTLVHGSVLIGLFVLFIGYVAIRESRSDTPVFRDAEMYEAYVGVRGTGGRAALFRDRETGGGVPDKGTALSGEEFSDEERSNEAPSDAASAAEGFAENMPFAEARKHSGWVGLGLAVLALAGLVVGAGITGAGTEGILETYGLEGTLFGATIATLVLTVEDVFLTVEPARKGAPEIGVGNVIGSVVFSVTGKLGVILLAGGIVVGPDVLPWHLPALIILTGLAAYFLSTGRLRRWHGFVLLGLYAAYWIISFAVFGTPPIEAE